MRIERFEQRKETTEMSEHPLTLFVSFPTTPLTDWRPSGDGLIAHQFIKGLAERGHRLHVVTPFADLRSPLPQQITIHQMSPRAPLTRPQPLHYMLWTRRTLQQIRATTHIDLIHELNPVFSLLSLAFVWSGVPVVLGPQFSRWPSNADGSGSFLQRIRRRLTNLLKDACVGQQHRYAKAILLSTPAALNNVAKPERVMSRLFILPPGIDHAEFSVRPDSSAQLPTVLFLAHVLIRKGIYCLIDAFETLVSRVPDVRLVIAGGGSELAAVKERVAASSYHDRVQFLGRVNRAEVVNLIQQCTVYCLPSDGEPFGMTALEAMACGKPLVVTGAGGLAYIVSEQGGRRVPVKDPAALARALEKLLKNPILCRQMGQYNRTQVETHYAWPRVTRRLEHIYEQVLGIATRTDADRITPAHIAEYRRRAERNPSRSASPGFQTSDMTVQP
jgi:glycosyltransferase involved in cell wall biosynthesis